MSCRHATRKALVANYQRFYRPFAQDARECFYCRADYPDTVDHVPAISRLASVGASEFRARNIPIVLVRCCNECNTLLGARALDTLEARTTFLYAKAQRAAKQRKFTGDWSADEIAELGDGLRPLVAMHARRAETLWARVIGLSATIVHYDDAGWPTAVSLEAA